MKALGLYEDATIVITGDHAWSVNDYLLIGEELWADKGDEVETGEASDNEEETVSPEENLPENDPDDDSDDRGVRLTAMFFKKSGVSGEPIKTSTAQVSQDELWNTILESEGLEELKKGLSFFDIPEGEDRERRYILQIDAKPEINELEEDQLVIYKIVGSGLVPENWIVEERISIGNMYK